jgi:hypothetical protein
MIVKRLRPGITAFCIGVLVGILASVQLVISVSVAIAVVLILLAIWLLPGLAGSRTKTVKRRLPRQGRTTKRRRASARK